MGCDMILACGNSTAQRHALLAANFFDAARPCLAARSYPAAAHPLDAAIQASQIHLPQARHTSALLGLQPGDAWGMQFGCNEHRVAIGAASWRSRLPAQEPGLSGLDLTRLGLERGHSAMHAVEVVTDLIARHGQRNPDEAAPDSILLIADPNDAFVLEAAGRSWALSQCVNTRAVADVGLIRQDWKRLSPGLAVQAAHNGWWQDDGAKLDFGGVLGVPHADQAWSLKRWSKATLALAQRQGALDAHALRQVLADHFETCVRRHALAPATTQRLASVVVRLDANPAPVFWCAPGTADTPLFFPLIVGLEIPAAHGEPMAWNEPAAAPALVKRLQRQFDQELAEFLGEERQLRERGEMAALGRLAQAMMLRHVEHWDAGTRQRVDPPAVAVSRPLRADEEQVAYSFG